MIRIIGDVHGHIEHYLKIAKQVPYSLQIGDMGFDYRRLSELNLNHRFIPGNHDNYNSLPEHALEWGLWKNIFCVRGAWSIDGCTGLWKNTRVEGIDWFVNEELSTDELEKCIEYYELVKPDVVCSHEAPLVVVEELQKKGFLISNFPVVKTRTGLALQRMLEIHSPKRWFFGHYHVNYETEVLGCKFRCIDELNYVDIEV